jgi:hypothetical protein
MPRTSKTPAREVLLGEQLGRVERGPIGVAWQDWKRARGRDAGRLHHNNKRSSAAMSREIVTN